MELQGKSDVNSLWTQKQCSFLAVPELGRFWPFKGPNCQVRPYIIQLKSFTSATVYYFVYGQFSIHNNCLNGKCDGGTSKLS